MKKCALFLCVLLGFTTAQASPKHVTYHELRYLEHFSTPICWSPRDARLALRGGEGVYVFDAAKPDVPPRLVVTGPWSGLDWSPDAQWLLVSASAPPQPVYDRIRIEAVPLGTGKRWVVYFGAERFGPMWASDGYVYAWHQSPVYGLERYELEPPPGYIAHHPGPIAPTTYLVWGVNQRGQSRPTAFRCRPSPKDWAIVNWDSTGADNVFPRGSDARGTRFLVTLFGLPNRDRDQIIDAEGHVVARVGTSQAEWTSLSGDGSLLAGHHEIDQGDNIGGGILYVGDAKGAWTARVATKAAAIHPRLSREGLYVCFEDPVAGGLHVGELILGGR
jgi:hypothetical protein